MPVVIGLRRQGSHRVPFDSKGTIPQICREYQLVKEPDREAARPGGSNVAWLISLSYPCSFYST
jgi:hypothetical protein